MSKNVSIFEFSMLEDALLSLLLDVIRSSWDDPGSALMSISLTRSDEFLTSSKMLPNGCSSCSHDFALWKKSNNRLKAPRALILQPRIFIVDSRIFFRCSTVKNNKVAANFVYVLNAKVQNFPSSKFDLILRADVFQNYPV